jgi:phosphate transport system permease protein
MAGTDPAKAAAFRTESGSFFVWGTGAAVTVTFAILVLLIVVILANGLGFFWLSDIAVGELKDGSRVMGEIMRREKIPEGKGWRVQFKVGNRDLYGQDFRWLPESQIKAMAYPGEAAMLERREFGNFYGFLKRVALPGGRGAGTDWTQLRGAMEIVAARAEEVEELEDEVSELTYGMEAIRQRGLKLKHRGASEAEISAQQAEFAALRRTFSERSLTHGKMLQELRRFTATFTDAGGKERAIVLVDIMRAHQPNRLSVWAKTGVYLGKLWELLSGEPREANTEGGLFPAIFGTVMMVMVMSLFCIPLGVVAAIYLREYAKQGWLLRAVRVAVYNLAGVPSIVYGVFGLGFFVYGVGATIDELFFAERLPTPTFGTGGILWASLTLALLTVPVVIVATEEALASIPRGIREGSLALGATQFQTLVRNLLPLATPGIMTGFILAVARAAGEVAPLMITGVVKLAPALPVDGVFPYVHLDRKFMHLGFHIYDVGFQSPNVEAAKPMVYITTLLLVLIVILLSLSAIYLRNTMRRRYQTGTF